LIDVDLQPRAIGGDIRNSIQNFRAEEGGALFKKQTLLGALRKSRKGKRRNIDTGTDRNRDQKRTGRRERYQTGRKNGKVREGACSGGETSKESRGKKEHSSAGKY